MAKTYLESMLGEREKILYSTRQHNFLLVSSILFEIILILVLLAAIVTVAIVEPSLGLLAVVIGFGLILIPIATMTRDILSWTNYQYVITNRRVVQISGIIDKSVTDSSLEKVNDVKLTQTALGRLFNYGDIEIMTASETGVDLFKRIGHPIEFKTAMQNAKEELESGENFTRGDFAMSNIAPDIPSLLAKLGELRQQGLLTEEEFQTKKKQLLSRI